MLIYTYSPNLRFDSMVPLPLFETKVLFCDNGHEVCLLPLHG